MNYNRLHARLLGFQIDDNSFDFLAFGDSFVKMFLHCSNVKHYKFKGKSIKGLIKQQDPERKKIQDLIRKTPNESILFFFGQVDFNFVRYYKVLNNEPEIPESVFEAYVKWVGSLSKKCVIISIFPTPISKQNVIRSLISKGTYLHENVTEEKDKIIYEEYERTNQIWWKWNSWIQKYSQKYKVRNIKLFPTNKLDSTFKDVSSITPHLRYVPVLKLVKKYFDIHFDEIQAQKIENQYEVDKEERVKNSKIRQLEREAESLKNEENQIIEDQIMIKRLHAKSEDHINISGREAEKEESEGKPLSQGKNEVEVEKQSEKKQSSTSQSKEEIKSIESDVQKQKKEHCISLNTKKVREETTEIIIGKKRQNKTKNEEEIKKGKNKNSKPLQSKKKILKYKQKTPEKKMNEKNNVSDSESDVDESLFLSYAKKK